MSDSEYDTDYYDKEHEIINKMFPDAKFSICIDSHEMNELLTDKKRIVIKQTYNCYCYSEYPRNTEYFYINGDRLTYKYVIDELIKQGLNPNCNHRFLEIIHPSKNSEVQYEIFFGS